MIALSGTAYAIAAHFDGRNTLRDIQTAIARDNQGLRVDAKVLCNLADELDRAGFLEGPAFEALRAKVLAEFRANPIREAVCAGGSYPDDPAELRRFLDRFFTHPQGPGDGGKAGAGKPVRALVAPHIDLHRGGPCYAHAYRALREGCDADLFVVFGTAHATPRRLFTLTRKSYDTPLGAVQTDQNVVDALAAELGEDELFGDELVHRQEHSCEFQILWLKHLFGERKITAVPVLCSSIDHLSKPSERVSKFVKALQKAVKGRKVCFIAGADLAHIGVMYGDPRGATPAELAGFKQDDLGTVKHYCGADAHKFAIDARRNGDQRRLCGTAPMFVTKLAVGEEAPGELLDYGQWTDGTDSVSYCAVRIG
ncbi:MAG: AmmeMemoRadiSam system protein B [Deltaproteobacteria bacterium]|nr:AmmeMemoRadiSam system protein B [Deltaproteobacteria bacterium]